MFHKLLASGGKTKPAAQWGGPVTASQQESRTRWWWGGLYTEAIYFLLFAVHLAKKQEKLYEERMASAEEIYHFPFISLTWIMSDHKYQLIRCQHYIASMEKQQPATSIVLIVGGTQLQSRPAATATCKQVECSCRRKSKQAHRLRPSRTG